MKNTHSNGYTISLGSASSCAVPHKCATLSSLRTKGYLRGVGAKNFILISMGTQGMRGANGATGYR